MSAIKDAKKLAIATDRDSSLLACRAALDDVSMRLKRGKRLRKSLLGVEKGSEASLDSQISDLEAQRAALREQLRFLDPPRYHSLSLEPLSWRDGNGFPKLAIFSLDSPLFVMAARGWEGGWTLTPRLPEGLLRHFKDVGELLTKKASRRDLEVKLSCEFVGVIPDEVRDRIEDAKHYFKHILLLAEPGAGFKLEEVARVVPKEDPLVVGSDGHSLWLIADFETTPVEEALIFHETKKVTP